MVNFKKVFDAFGGQNKTAGALDVSTQAISQWRAKGYFPPAQAIEIERLTKGEFKAVDLVSKKGE